MTDHYEQASAEARQRGMAFLVDGKHVNADRVMILSVPDTIGPISRMRQAKDQAASVLEEVRLERVCAEQLVDAERTYDAWKDEHKGPPLTDQLSLAQGLDMAFNFLDERVENLVDLMNKRGHSMERINTMLKGHHAPDRDIDSSCAYTESLVSAIVADIEVRDNEAALVGKRLKELCRLAGIPVPVETDGGMHDVAFSVLGQVNTKLRLHRTTEEGMELIMRGGDQTETMNDFFPCAHCGSCDKRMRDACKVEDCPRRSQRDGS